MSKVTDIKGNMMDRNKLSEQLSKFKDDPKVESKTLLERLSAIGPQPTSYETEQLQALKSLHGPEELAKLVIAQKSGIEFSELMPIDLLNSTFTSGYQTTQSAKSNDNVQKEAPKALGSKKIETDMSRLKHT